MTNRSIPSQFKQHFSVIIFHMVVRQRCIYSTAASLDLSLNTILMIVLPNIADDPQALAGQFT